MWVTKAQGERFSERFKEGSVIYRDPRIQGRVGWMKLWGGECSSVGCPAVKKKGKRKKKQGSLSVSVCLSPLWLFHLSLTNSSSGAQPLVDSLSRQQKTMATSAGRACPVPKVCPLWLPQLSSFGHRLESITKQLKEAERSLRSRNRTALCLDEKVKQFSRSPLSQRWKEIAFRLREKKVEFER